MSTMIRIDTDQLEELIHKDVEVKKDLEIVLKDDMKSYQICFKAYHQAEEELEKIQKKAEKLRKEIQEQKNFEDRLHAEINRLEIQKIFAERKRKRLLKKISESRDDEEKHLKYIHEFGEVEETIANLESKQESIRDEISENRSLVAKMERKEKSYIEKAKDAEREKRRHQQNVTEWQLSIETKTNLFYQQTFDTMMAYYEPLRDLLVRNLQKDKYLTKEEAKAQLLSEMDKELTAEKAALIREKEQKQKKPSQKTRKKCYVMPYKNVQQTILKKQLYPL